MLDRKINASEQKTDPKVYVMGLSIKTSADDKDHIMEIAASVQTLDSKIIQEFHCAQKAGEKDPVAASTQFIADLKKFIDEMNQRCESLTQVSWNLIEDVGAINRYFRKNEMRDPLSYTGKSEKDKKKDMYNEIIDIPSYLHDLREGNDNFNVINNHVKSINPENPDSNTQKEARKAADYYNQLSKAASKMHIENADKIANLDKNTIAEEKAATNNSSIDGAPVNPKNEYVLTFNAQTRGIDYKKHGVIAIAASVKDQYGNEIDSFTANIKPESNQKIEERCLNEYWINHLQELAIMQNDQVSYAEAINGFNAFKNKYHEKYGTQLEQATDDVSHSDCFNHLIETYAEDKTPIQNVKIKADAKKGTPEITKSVRIWDTSSKQRILAKAKGQPHHDQSDNYTAYLNWAPRETSKTEHLALSKARYTADCYNNVSKTWKKLRKACANTVIEQYKEQKRTFQKKVIEQLLLIFPDTLDLIKRISNYLFICDYNSNHLHALDNDEFFKLSKTIECQIERVLLALFSVHNEYFNLALGGSSALSRCYDSMHTAGGDCDFEVIKKANAPKAIDVYNELLKLKESIFKTLSSKLLTKPEDDLPAFTTISSDEETILSWGDAIHYFTIQLHYPLAAASKTHAIDLGFISFPGSRYMYALNDAPILRYSEVPHGEMHTIDKIEILAGKIASFVANNGIFTECDYDRTEVKNFFAIYKIWMDKDIKENSAALFEAIQRHIDLTIIMSKNRNPGFDSNPIASFKDALSCLETNARDNFGEDSDLALQHATLVKNRVVSGCDSHTFSDTVAAAKEVLSQFLKYANGHPHAYAQRFFGKPPHRAPKKPSSVTITEMPSATAPKM